MSDLLAVADSLGVFYEHLKARPFWGVLGWVWVAASPLVVWWFNTRRTDSQIKEERDARLAREAKDDERWQQERAERGEQEDRELRWEVGVAVGSFTKLFGAIDYAIQSGREVDEGIMAYLDRQSDTLTPLKVKLGRSKDHKCVAAAMLWLESADYAAADLRATAAAIKSGRPYNPDDPLFEEQTGKIDPERLAAHMRHNRLAVLRKGEGQLGFVVDFFENQKTGKLEQVFNPATGKLQEPLA
jgi:hypothetical protein